MQLVSMPVFARPDAVDFTNQDRMATLHETRIVKYSSCCPSLRLTITSCCPTCLISKDIKSGLLCDKIDVVNNAFPYLIKFVAWIVTDLSYICWCFIVA